MLNASDQARIAEAVAKAEDGTSGEVICVLAREVSNYPEVALTWAAVIAFAVPALALAIGMHPLSLAIDVSDWVASQGLALEGKLTRALGFYAALQAALFAAVFLFLEIPAVRRFVTPKFLKRHKVDRAARSQFAAIGARAVGSQTGVLLFVALDDRQVRVLADKTLHGKADDAAWKAAAQAIASAMKGGHDPTAGIVQAVEICGAVLRAHFPSDAPHQTVFSNRPVEI